MGSLYGYEAANHEGTAYNARIQSYNQGVLLGNQLNMDNYHTSVSLQKRNKSDDSTSGKEDKAYYAGTDLKDGLGQVGALGEMAAGVYKNGFVGYAKGSTAGRLNTIKTTAKALIAGKPIPPETAPPPSTGPTESGLPRSREPPQAPSRTPPTYTHLADDDDDVLGAAPGPTGQANIAGRAGPTPLAGHVDSDEEEGATGAEEGAEGAEQTANVAGKAKPTPLAGSVEEVAGGAEQTGEIESSGLGTKIVKSGLKYALGDKVGEAGLSAISEVGGKALGDFSGVGDIAEGFKNMAEGGSFFKGDSTGDKFAEAGAVFDLAGTAFPPLEAVGGVLNFISAIDNTKDALKTIHDKKVADSTTITQPPPQQMKVSPTFSSLGLVASAPMSAKKSIVGSGTF